MHGTAQVVHPAAWLGHQAKGLLGLGFETQSRQEPGGIFGFPKLMGTCLCGE